MSRGMKIVSLVLRETGTYNDMASRPYRADVNTDAMVRFDEATRGGTIFGVESLAGIAGTLLAPSANPDGLIHIENGFNRPRFRFLMEVEHIGAMGAGHRQVLVGYTDTLGGDVSHNGQEIHVDPDLRLYVNSVLTLREVMHETPSGRRNQRTVFDNSHVLSADYSPSIRSGEGNTPVRLRPEDVLANMSFSEKSLSGGMRDFGGVSELVDYRATFGDGICKSRRSNNSATSYLATLLSSRKKAVDKASTSNGADRFTLIESSRGFAQESMVSEDLLLGPLQRETSLARGSSITFGELQDIAPYLDEVTDVMMSERIHRDSAMPHQVGESAEWFGNDQVTVQATALCHSVPSIMMDLMITGIEFRSTNRTRNGEIVTNVNPDVRMFVKEIDAVPFINTFIDRLENEVLKDLTRFNRADFDLTMRVNVLGETKITISLNGSRDETWVVPSFCDALYVPVIGRDVSNLSALASDVSEMTDMVRSSMSVSLARDESRGSNNYNDGGNSNDRAGFSV